MISKEEDDRQLGGTLIYGSPYLCARQASDKFLGDTAYYTCGIKRGKVYGMVLCPAKQSFVGKTAALVMGSNARGHFQTVLGDIGTILLVLVFAFIFAAWIGALFRHVAIASPKQNNLFVYALILFIVGVPVGLPVSR